MAGRKQQIQALAQMFRILGDPSRLQIVITLGEGERNVTQLCRKLRMSQPTVSRHLGILKMSSMAEARRCGKEIHYSLPNGARRTLKYLIDRGMGLIK